MNIDVSNGAVDIVSELLTILPLFDCKRKCGDMRRKEDRKILSMLQIAVISWGGNETGRDPGAETKNMGMASMTQKIDDCIASAMKADGRFTYQLSFYQSVTGLMNSRKAYDVLIMWMGEEKTDYLKPEEMRWLKNVSARIICIAEGTGFLKDAFRIGVFRYALKEELEKDLPEALEEVLQEMAPVQGLRLTINGEDKWVPFEDIYYIEALGDEAIIYKKDTYSTVRKTMNYLLGQLGNAFFRCHKSYIVNFAYVQRIDNDSVILKDARSVPVSVRRRGALVKIYHCYEEMSTFDGKQQRLT